MQYVEGTSLWQVLRERRTLPPVEVMDIVAQVAAALEVAHEAGIVHRDLKPANMLVTPEGRVVLVDFGIARTLDADPLTLTGTIVGTADYISPEQSEGRSATSRSDLYSLGMVAYECLSGRKPFRRDSDVATALAHMVDEAPPLGPNVPEDVRALVERMIAKDPEDRPADAAEVAARASALAGPPARRGSPGRRRRPPGGGAGHGAAPPAPASPPGAALPAGARDRGGPAGGGGRLGVRRRAVPRGTGPGPGGAAGRGGRADPGEPWLRRGAQVRRPARRHARHRPRPAPGARHPRPRTTRS